MRIRKPTGSRMLHKYTKNMVAAPLERPRFFCFSKALYVFWNKIPLKTRISFINHVRSKYQNASKNSGCAPQNEVGVVFVVAKRRLLKKNVLEKIAPQTDFFFRLLTCLEVISKFISLANAGQTAVTYKTTRAKLKLQCKESDLTGWRRSSTSQHTFTLGCSSDLLFRPRAWHVVLTCDVHKMSPEEDVKHSFYLRKGVRPTCQ